MRPTPTIIAAVALNACVDGPGIGPVVDPPDIPEPRPIEPRYNTDVLVQAEQPIIDVLFVIDDSCSMVDDQAALSTNAPAFMQWFVASGLDFHIGVVSTDVVDPTANGRLQSPSDLPLWLDSNTPNAVEAFRRMAVLGSSGASPERGLDGLYRAIEAEGDDYNRGFLRNDSSLNVIVTSDEDDFSMDVSEAEFVRWFGGLRDPDQLTFSAIQNPLPGASGPGRKYGTVAQNFRGQVWDINQADWADMLERLGLQATGRRAEFFLSQTPVAPTIEVRVRLAATNAVALIPEAVFDDEGEVTEAGWVYVPGRNSILFYDFIPPDLSRVEVTYQLP